ncbi:MAG: orotate phosphoribosyltransferase [Candidatus Altiarchaeota archaeon]
MMDKRDVAGVLLKINAVKFNVDEPFTYASGIRSPVYTDCRLLMSHPLERRQVVDALKSMIEDEIGVEQFDVVAGTASAGIPHAAWLSELFGKPMVYVRKKSKGHGLQKNIEGTVPEGRKVLLVEDLVSTGGSSMDAVRVLRDAGAVVEHVAAIFTYSLPRAEKLFHDNSIQLHPLTDFETALAEAVNSGYMAEEQSSRALGWKRDPEGWQDKK